VNSSLQQLDLSPADRALIAETQGFMHVRNRIKALEQEILAKTEKIKYAKQLADLANALCEFATRISGVVEIFIPQSPEYVIPFNCIVLIFKACRPIHPEVAQLTESE
jgi:hypothetical protein